MSTEEKILVAAKEVFTQKGFAAARMQEIADTADINKGLLHYYFRSKQKLFQAIFDEAFEKFILRINPILDSDLPLFEKIDAFVHQYIDILISNPHIPSFVINELNQNKEEFIERILSKKEKPNPMKLLVQIQMEAQAGKIRDINPFHFFLNLISMCIFPFLGRPLFQGVMSIDDQTYMQFMEMRKKEIVEFILHSIKKE